MYDFLVEITTANFWRDLKATDFWIEFVFRDIKAVDDASIDVLMMTSVINFLIKLTEKNCFKSIDNDDETKNCFRLNIDDIFDEIMTANRCFDNDCCKSNWNNRLNRSNKKIISRIEFSYSLINFIALFNFERLRQTFFSDSYFFHRTKFFFSFFTCKFFFVYQSFDFVKFDAKNIVFNEDWIRLNKFWSTKEICFKRRHRFKLNYNEHEVNTSVIKYCQSIRE